MIVRNYSEYRRKVPLGGLLDPSLRNTPFEPGYVKWLFRQLQLRKQPKLDNGNRG